MTIFSSFHLLAQRGLHTHMGRGKTGTFIEVALSLLVHYHLCLSLFCCCPFRCKAPRYTEANTVLRIAVVQYLLTEICSQKHPAGYSLGATPSALLHCCLSFSQHLAPCRQKNTIPNRIPGTKDRISVCLLLIKSLIEKGIFMATQI